MSAMVWASENCNQSQVLTKSYPSAGRGGRRNGGGSVVGAGQRLQQRGRQLHR